LSSTGTIFNPAGVDRIGDASGIVHTNPGQPPRGKVSQTSSAALKARLIVFMKQVVGLKTNSKQECVKGRCKAGRLLMVVATFDVESGQCGESRVGGLPLGKVF
jgi:hypothetical protein